MNKLFKNFFFIEVFILFILSANICFAINPPTSLTPCAGNDISLSPLFNWNDVPGADHYELYYKRADETNWTDRYPSISQYQVIGLSPAAAYQWYVVACADAACANKAESSVCSFSTQQLAPSPGPGPGPGPGSPIDLINPLKAQTLEEAINALINFLFYLAMGISPILIIYAAFLILTAGGDAAKISRARTIILWTLIAVAIVLLAKGLPSAIKGALGG